MNLSMEYLARFLQGDPERAASTRVFFPDDKARSQRRGAARFCRCAAGFLGGPRACCAAYGGGKGAELRCTAHRPAGSPPMHTHTHQTKKQELAVARSGQTMDPAAGRVAMDPKFGPGSGLKFASHVLT